MRLMPKFIQRKINAEVEKQTAVLKGQFSNSLTKIKAQAGFSQGFSSRFLGNRSGGGKWQHGLSASGAGLMLDHRRLRQNARDAYHDSVPARGLVDRWSDTVADIGLMLEAAPKAEILGITEEEAEKWGANVESRFDSWARDKKQHRAENMNFYQTHRLYQIQQHRDNDIFIRLFYAKDKNLQNPLQFQFLDAEQIRGDAFTSTFATTVSKDGINRDKRGREVSYDVWIQDPEDPTKYKVVQLPRKGPKSGRLFMLHGFVPDYAGQGRGYSRLAHAIQEFENITDFSAATIKKAINQSNIIMWTTNDQEDPSNPVEDILTNSGAGPVSGVKIQDGQAVEESTLNNDPSVGFCELPEATLAVPGSTGLFNLIKGDKLEMAKNTSPGDSYNAFIDAFTSYLAASTGMPLEVMLMKFNENYSASRAALILFWRVVQMWREEMASDYLNPVYEMWLAEEIAAGRIVAPGWSDPRLRAAWLNNRWIGSPMPNIDPKRTADSDQKYVEMGAQTLDRVSRSLNGSSGKANRAKLKREFKELPESPFNKKGGGPNG